MKIVDLRRDWHELSALLDQALELSDSARDQWLANLPDPQLQYRDSLIALLNEERDGKRSSTMIDELPGFELPHTAADEDLTAVAIGQIVGPYRIISLLGSGGMGSVWLAERVDCQPRRKVALKLPHMGWAPSLMARLARERDILGSLEHPSIARLYDAGVDQHGRPFLALEYVDGVPIDDYCETRQLGLAERLRLLLQVAAAVSFAHTRLVVHRDLKPSNILVTAAGEVRLLDFGIAKFLQGASEHDDATRLTGLAVTPDYASPEQIRGEAIGTSSDVYSLAVVAYGLLARVRPYQLKNISGAKLRDAIQDIRIPPASRAAVNPMLKRQLRGDLDAILSKALKTDAAERYPTVAAFADDLQRYLTHRPVSACSDSPAYRFRKFLARYTLQASAAALVIAAVLAGTTTALWQAHAAHIEAARATAIKDFLLGVFSANDPRVASDKPRNEMTARDMMNVASLRIEKQFSQQPELQIELLGLTANIYDRLADEKRYKATQQRHIELARAHYGPAHPIVIAALLEAADAACVRDDYATASQLLAEADAGLRQSGSDKSLLRAEWWKTKARVFGATSATQSARQQALDQALALYAKYGPHTNAYAQTLSMAALDMSERGDHRQALVLQTQSLAVAQGASDRDDASIADLLINLAQKQQRVGNFDAADDTFQRAEQMSRSTYGEQSTDYWLALGFRARMLHYRGQRERAHVLFARMLAAIPSDWKINTNDQFARETYADCLAAEGRAAEAIPIFESAYQRYRVQKSFEYALREIRRKLGDAYDRVGRAAEARELLHAARDESMAVEAPDSQWSLRIRERWARFLLGHSKPGDPDFVAADRELQSVIDNGGTRALPELALAHADMAGIAGEQGQIQRALDESLAAMAVLGKVEGLYDLRFGPVLWLTRSAALKRSGDAAGAHQWAAKALEASLRYDDPSSAAITAARAALGQYNGPLEVRQAGMALEY